MDANMFGYAAVTILGLGGLVVISACGYYMLRACLLYGVFVEHGENDDKLAVNKFMELLNQAERGLIIYDDGDKVEDSIYDNKEVVEALKHKMEASPSLVVKVLFNEKTNVLLLDEMSQIGDQFEIRYRKGDRPEKDVHFKIADNTLGYFSQHDLGDTKRDFHFYDARYASRRARKRAFGNHLRYFDEQFKAAQA